MPARTEPVIATICGVGCSTRAAAGVAVAADDVEHARRQELLRELGEQRRATPAWCRDGLRTMVLPAASAGAIFQIIIISG